MEIYKTFLRSARNFKEFAQAEKVEQDTGLTYQEAREQCQQFNSNLTTQEKALGTKMEFEQE